MLKALIRFMLSFLVFLYQRSNGRIAGRMQGLPVLLLTTTGRKTGKQRTVPLGYLEHDGAYVVIASYAGADVHPAWYLNLLSQPQVMIQVQDKQMAAIAEPADPELRQQLWARLVERAPGYEAYQKRTTREIPIVLLRPVTQS